MEADNPDIFLLYNEREEMPNTIASELRHREVSLYFYRSDVPFGGKISEIEADRLKTARGVVVLLGDQGWGVSQAQLGQEATQLGKPILPVLIGSPPDEAMDQVGRLFRDRRRLDLRKPSPELFDQLADAIQVMLSEPAPSPFGVDPISSVPTAPRFDEIINTLVDGSDLDRSLLLQRIMRYPMPNC